MKLWKRGRFKAVIIKAMVAFRNSEIHLQNRYNVRHGDSFHKSCKKITPGFLFLSYGDLMALWTDGVLSKVQNIECTREDGHLVFQHRDDPHVLSKLTLHSGTRMRAHTHMHDFSSFTKALT